MKKKRQIRTATFFCFFVCFAFCFFFALFLLYKTILAPCIYGWRARHNKAESLNHLSPSIQEEPRETKAKGDKSVRTISARTAVNGEGEQREITPALSQHPNEPGRQRETKAEASQPSTRKSHVETKETKGQKSSWPFLVVLVKLSGSSMIGKSGYDEVYDTEVYDNESDDSPSQTVTI